MIRSAEAVASAVGGKPRVSGDDPLLDEAGEAGGG